ncbi:hypothetical protein M0R72_22050 [Candidatus Pacearchaeota archaeon]|jgi:hypothetical protein|nr:hypothetical protein [Candidatus Pacearchaeota archaeon]
MSPEELQKIRDFSKKSPWRFDGICYDTIRSLLDHIDSLQSALIKECFWNIWREGKHDDVAKVTELAKKQLRAEMPEEMA